MTKQSKAPRKDTPGALELSEDRLDRIAAGVVDPTGPNVVYVGGSRVGHWEKDQELRSGKWG